MLYLYIWAPYHGEVGVKKREREAGVGMTEYGRLTGIVRKK